MKKFLAYFALFATLMSFNLSVHADLIVNEYMTDPNAGGGDIFDSNMDGNADSSEDEFIEFVNNMATSLDISSWTVADGAGVRHTFAAGTVLAPGQAFVLFGGGTPNAANFGGALIATADVGFLGLNNGGDDIIVNDGMMDVINANFAGADGVSVTRNPDLTGAFVDSDTLPGGFRATAGFQNDGVTPFPVPEPTSLGLLALMGIAVTVRRQR